MKRVGVAIVGAAVVLLTCGPAPASAQENSSLAGRWTLNRALSQFPREIGFGAQWAAAAAGGDEGSSGGGGRRRGSSGGGGTPFTATRESPDDASRVRQLTAEVRNPSTHLVIAETAGAVTMTNDQGETRTFHPDGKEEVIRLKDVPVAVTARWEAGQLVIVYQVEEGRQLRYAYSTSANPPQLIVDVKFLERGGGDTVRRVYGPAAANETMTVPAAAPQAASSGAAPAPSRPATPGVPPESAADAAAALNQLQVPAAPQQPDAELKGIAKLGLVVEELSPQAAVCGLKQAPIETAMSKLLSDAGFTVAKNSDEDTYLYVNVMTMSLPSGFCVSRYDAFVYTNTTARLSYQGAPVLVQVSLLHKGGIAGGAPAAHGEAVLKALKENVGEFATRIRNASK